MADIFHPQYPTLRLVWDATSLDNFMRDPLAYYWKYVEGWRSREKSVDLLWGSAWDAAVANYHIQRAALPDEQRDTALEATITKALDAAKAVDLDAVAAETPKDKGRKKNTMTLIRALVWYDAEFGDYDTYRPIMTLPRQAVAALAITAPGGLPYTVVGNYDEVVKDSETGKILVVERKTTTQAISPHYWLTYDPSVQVNTYDWLAAQQMRCGGVLLEACQTGIGFTRFAHHPVYRTDQQRQHWTGVLKFWIKFAEQIALADDWHNAMNLATQQWNSTTRNIERRSPALWNGLLRTQLQKRKPWNPLEVE